jgi:hypothetical protein
LSINTFITAGSWLAVDPAKVWEDYDDEHWDELP